ncbi:MAG: hypothetical protein A2Z29_03015 [Chloroflexi bacterium RBG_16_56_11]|nr:MAG: hypothetical protein A2Z29_03015 [Chloroflexi bacterium RBG_16_56_11]
MVKMIIGFFAGMAVCGLVFFGAGTILSAYAGTDDSGELSDNATGGLTGLLPDIEQIYNQALTLPFKKAESKIYDEDIREFYHELINSTGLGGTGAGTD